MAPIENIEFEGINVSESRSFTRPEDALLNPNFEEYHDDSGDDDSSRREAKPLPPLPVQQWSRGLALKIIGGAFILVMLILTTLLSRHMERARKSKSQAMRLIPSRDFALNFPQIYPPLDYKKSTPECVSAWKNLTSVPCHSEISTRNWDTGIMHIFGPSLDRYVPLICKDGCADALLQAQTLLESTCSTSAFSLAGYKGKFNTTLLEHTPSKVLDVLVQRHAKMCRTSPTGDAERGFCMTDLDSRWNIVDGIYDDGMDGLSRFIAATKRLKTEPAGRHQGMQGSGGWSEKYDYLREERKFGPGPGETTCSWCTLTWMEDKLGLWHEGMSVKDGEVLGLRQFLKMWERAGKRCAGQRFSEAYVKAVKAYIDRGLLTQDWESQPSGDVWYLLDNGPSRGDYPIPQVEALLLELKTYRESNEKNDSAAGLLGIASEYSKCLSAFQDAALSMGCYPFLSFQDITTYTLSSMTRANDICANRIGIDDLSEVMDKACPLGRLDWNAYDKKLAGAGLTISPLLNKIFGEEGTIENHTSSCVITGGLSCGAIFAKWGFAEWMMDSVMRTSAKDLVRLTRKTLATTPWPREGLLGWKPPTDRLIKPEDRAIASEQEEYMKGLRHGICSDCLWQRYVQDTWSGSRDYVLLPKGTPEDVAMEWLKTLHMLADGCTARGVRRVISESTHEWVDNRNLSEMEKAWIRRYSKELFVEAFREGRNDPPWLG